MSEQKRKLEQDFRRLSELCVTLDAEKNDLKAKYEKAVECLKVYEEIDRINGYEGPEYPARQTPAELGEK